ncbi:serine/threonine protein kinase [Streptomyces sp. NRRL F-5122]|uniref:serine/threonine-protein kinase n=1 Tax=Streptomyces sp. NRRL F-5122 TaxID=1609098 RepID=UPI000740F95F|nr:serine/threonine-protein kinase [Streptomyces sp. NRRL F-5122]KUJ33716.1 serine/threonine protein kinase [Streptomyces sp. NRRL F-5122]
MDKLGAGDPQRIGAYRLLARLGAGGMGRVYLARSDRGRTVAVKLVRRELAEQEEFRARFRQEVHAARQVGGYWTAPVLDADTEADIPWVATGYVAGPTLQAVVSHDHGALPERSVGILAAGLAHALQDIHAAGLIHRDLKPSNVLVTIDGPRVIDFGIARALETLAGAGLTRTGALVGSPGFMAPEQVRGDRITPACDVFCLGSVLAYAATGTLPFGDANSAAHALMFRIAQEDPDLEGLPEGLDDLVRDCLRKDPAARPALAEILERSGAEDTVSGGRSKDPWLPGVLVAQLGRHAVRLLDTEDPEEGTRGTATVPVTAPGGAMGQAVDPGHFGPAAPASAGAVPEGAMAGAGAEGPRVPGAEGGGQQVDAVGGDGATGRGGPTVSVEAGPRDRADLIEQVPAPRAAGVPLEHASAADPADGTDGPDAPPPGGSRDLERRPTEVVRADHTSVPAPHPAHGHPQQHLQPPAYGYPQHAGGRGGATDQAYGPTPPYGPSSYGPSPYGDPGQPEPARRSGRSTAVLIVVALVVALGAGGSVFALMRGGGIGTSGGAAPSHTSAAPTTHGPTTPAPSSPASASPTSPSPAAGAVPYAYLGTWNGSIDNSGGHSTRSLVIEQGAVGDPVLSLTAEGPAGSGTYHCVFRAKLAEEPASGGPLRIGPSTVTVGSPASSCTPGAATELTILPDGRLERLNTSTGESLTYTKVN